MNIREHFVRNGLGLDPRSLGLLRVLFACGLLVDLFRNAESRLGPTLCALVFGILAVGYRTRLFQVLTLLGIFSIHPRLLRFENLGDACLSLLAISSVLVPLGRRLSLDALLQSMRVRPEHHAEQLADRAAMRPKQAPMISSRGWDAIEQHLRAGGRRLTCFFDSDCGICFQFARVLARIDIWERIHIVSNQDRQRLPADVSDDIISNTIVVRDEQTGRITTRSDAIAELGRALPLGWPIWAVLKLPGLRGVWLRVYDRVAKNRVAISLFFGLNACGLPSPIGLRRESGSDVAS
jgi:predicted DCC family thiol-disulfide oxidoreductase YuxK